MIVKGSTRFATFVKGTGLVHVQQETTRRGRTACATLFFMVMSSLWCYASDVVLIRLPGRPSPEQHELELATQFYGLGLDVVIVDANHAASVLDPVERRSTLGVAIEADALATVNRGTLLETLRRRPGSNVPVLILGVTPETDPTLLSTWSSAAVVGAARIKNSRLNYVVGQAEDITQELSGMEMPFPGEDVYYFTLEKKSNAQEIMMVRKGDEVVPIFIKAGLQQQNVFLLSRTHLSGDTAADWNADNVVDAFAKLAPVMIFVKHCAGERGWHAPGHYANFTIDDPWLREPYGDLNYKGLLDEMERHDFHTTIAFVPWNFDRGDSEVLSLFREYPNRFSISVHGNNHDHKEFEGLHDKPIDVQVAGLKQALARMDKFQRLTGIQYDKVFVFPHSIGPERTLEELRRYNYLATVNSTNVPMDSVSQSEPLFALRSVTTSFADFPSVIRYPASMANPSTLIAINTFLGNPVLFYAHHDFFAKSIGAFDEVADVVNKVEPSTQWASLGDIASHLYQVRLRDDSNYDVLTPSSSIYLANTVDHDLVYYVKKHEVSPSTISSVTVDGQSMPFQVHDGILDISITVPAGEARNVAVTYKNDLDLASISTSRRSLRAYLLRKASDFRDIWLSKSYVGAALTAIYYRDDKAPVRIIEGACMLMALCIALSCTLVVTIKKRMRVAAVSNSVPIDGVVDTRKTPQ